MSSDFPAVFLKTAHLFARALDDVRRTFETLDALLAAGCRHDKEKVARRTVTADLITNLFAASIEQPNHPNKVAQDPRDSCLHARSCAHNACRRHLGD